MLSFRVINFLPPQNTISLELNTSSGTWSFQQVGEFPTTQANIQNGQVGETYFLEHPVSMNQGAAKVDEASDELTPILLAITYLTGLSVTIERSTAASEIEIMQPSDHWPRARSLHQPSYIVSSDDVLISAVEAFALAWPSVGQDEKVLLLIHHWIDALGCWSLEDLFLSTTTILQVISATEESRQNTNLSFFAGLQGAATRSGIVQPDHDWVKMRNDLIHDGSLSATRFSNKTKNDCADIAAAVLNWIDTYINTVLGLHCDAMPRFTRNDMLSLKAYSLD